jgi:Snf7
MSWLVSWWTGSHATPEIGETISTNIDNKDALIAKRMQLLKRSADLLKEAKASPKARAITLLKQRQQVEQQAAVYEGMIANVEKTTMALDSAATSVQLARTMKQSSVNMKQLMTEVTVGDVDQIADELDDNLSDVRALTDALSRPMGMDIEDADEDIARQLQEWDAETVVDELPKLPQRAREKIPIHE